MDIKPRIGVCLNHKDPDQSASLKLLAETLRLECFSGDPTAFDFILGITGDRLELTDVGETESKSLFVDFLAGPSYYRFVKDRRINQPLARAAGVKPGYRPRILDATAGFGEDGFVLASLGCNVTLIERAPVIWALLNDGLRRAKKSEALGRLAEKNMLLIRTDSIDYIKCTRPPFETIFLDPIFPPRTGSALNKKKMRVLKKLVGNDPDASELLDAALAHTGKRVCVKRPTRADPLGSREPSFSITARSSRYDVYLA